MLAHKGDIELDLIGWRCACQAVKAIEQTIPPQPDRIVFLQYGKLTDASGPLERTEDGIVGIERPLSA